MQLHVTIAMVAKYSGMNDTYLRSFAHARAHTPHSTDNKTKGNVWHARLQHLAKPEARRHYGRTQTQNRLVRIRCGAIDTCVHSSSSVGLEFLRF